MTRVQPRQNLMDLKIATLAMYCCHENNSQHYAKVEFPQFSEKNSVYGSICDISSSLINLSVEYSLSEFEAERLKRNSEFKTSNTT